YDLMKNPAPRSIWIIPSFVTQLADRRPGYFACLLCVPPALFFKETERRALLQRMGGGEKSPVPTSPLAATLKRLSTNLTCPSTAPLLTPSICPFLTICIAS